jgi:predicted alpha/beta-hydrolase family hydrolase
VEEISTAAGPALVTLEETRKPGFLFVLTHGAGGGVDTPDVLAASKAALGLGGTVARVLQPYRVRGATAPGSPDRQDAAWLQIVAALRDRYPGVPLIQGGRSNGARVACRTAVAAGARAVVALAFPLHPPGRPDSSRAGELRQAGTASSDAARVVVLPGETHALSRHPAAVGQAVGEWLNELLAADQRGGLR